MRLLLVEDWVLTSRLRKFLQVLFNGRDTLVEFDEPLSLRELLGEELAVRGPRAARGARCVRCTRGVARCASGRISRTGAPSSTSVLRTRAVRAAVTQEMRTKQPDPAQGDAARARRSARDRGELLARLRALHGKRAVAPVEPPLRRRRVRPRRDSGAGRRGATRSSTFPATAATWTTCCCRMRSTCKASPSRTSPPASTSTCRSIGRFLRKGGAFFIRRSFRGNALYTVVFMKYLAAIMARGHSHRVLHRRRPQPHRPAAAAEDRHAVDDGAQLPARARAPGGVRAGLLRLRAHGRRAAPTSGSSPGGPRRRKAFSGCCEAWRMLRERFGKVHVNLGEPIALDGVLDRHDRALALANASTTMRAVPG